MTRHFEERSLERYNLEITPEIEGTLIGAIKKQNCIYLYPSKENNRMHFAYVIYKHLPLKVLYHKSKNRKFRIITLYPLDVDEYNFYKEKQEQEKIEGYIRFLKKKGYIVYKNWRNTEK